MPDSLMLNELHPQEMENLLREAGFKVLKKEGFGLVPSGLYRGVFAGACGVIDHLTAGTWLTSRFGIDLVYLCSPA
jgi:hypothetical protein